MTTSNYERCYQTLELDFGADLKLVNSAWKRLSQLHHPDNYLASSQLFEQALEKQKQLNIARDLLKSWFAANPGLCPPRAAHTKPKNSKNNQAKDSKEQSKSAVFQTSAIELSLVQCLIRELKDFCTSASYAKDCSIIWTTILISIAVFMPLWLIANFVNFILPEFYGRYPYWLISMIFLCGFSSTVYLWRWFTASSQIIEAQEKIHYFRFKLNPRSTIELLKKLIEMHSIPGFCWQFSANGFYQCASLKLEKKTLVQPESEAQLQVRFAVAGSGKNTLLAMEVRSRPYACPIVCNKIVQNILQEISANNCL